MHIWKRSWKRVKSNQNPDIFKEKKSKFNQTQIRIQILADPFHHFPFSLIGYQENIRLLNEKYTFYRRWLTHPNFYSDLNPNFSSIIQARIQFLFLPFSHFCYLQNPNPHTFSDPPIGPVCGAKFFSLLHNPGMIFFLVLCVLILWIWCFLAFIFVGFFLYFCLIRYRKKSFIFFWRSSIKSWVFLRIVYLELSLNLLAFSFYNYVCWVFVAFVVSLLVLICFILIRKYIWSHNLEHFLALFFLKRKRNYFFFQFAVLLVLLYFLNGWWIFFKYIFLCLILISWPYIHFGMNWWYSIA